MVRTQALLKSLSHSQLPTPVLSGLEAYSVYNQDKSLLPSTQAQLLSEWQDIRATLAKLDVEASRH